MTLELRRRLTFQVVGIARPKGSLKAFHRPGMRFPVVTNDNPKTTSWQHLVAVQAQTVASGGLFLGPVVLHVTFELPRPKAIGKRAVHHTKKPDLDKLIRATKDALKGVLYADDAQVVSVHGHKVYAAPGGPPRARITLEAAEPMAPVIPFPSDLFAVEA